MTVHSQAQDISVSFHDVSAAYQHIRAAFDPSPLSFSPRISELVGHEIYLKWDNKLRTGSFKERGAVNTLHNLDENQRARGVCAASLGNHALALSHHARQFRTHCIIVMPLSTPLVKIQSTQKAGAEVILQGNIFDESQEYAIQLAAERGLKFVSAFDDPLVIAGQGTAGMEMVEQLADFDSVVVPMGGGGLISGIATAIKALKPDALVLGVRSEWATTHRANGAPAPLIPPSTIADGIAVKRPGKITSAIIAKRVDQLVTISESDIANAIVRLLELERTVVEGAGAAGVAALLKGLLPKHCKKTIVEISGSNIDMNVISRLIERDMAERERLLRVLVSVPDRPGSLHAVTGVLAKSGANVLDVLHDRSFSHIPGNVDITFLLEVKDRDHRQTTLAALFGVGLVARELV